MFSVASSSSSSSANAGVPDNTKCANKEEGASKRKRGRPRKAEPINIPSTSDRYHSHDNLANETQALLESANAVHSEHAVGTIPAYVVL